MAGADRDRIVPTNSLRAAARVRGARRSLARARARPRAAVGHT
eukprot:COSAG02_NODE_38178_length_432_cov_0.930931_1_plen_42_part_10